MAHQLAQAMVSRSEDGQGGHWRLAPGIARGPPGIQGSGGTGGYCCAGGLGWWGPRSHSRTKIHRSVALSVIMTESATEEWIKKPAGLRGQECGLTRPGRFARRPGGRGGGWPKGSPSPEPEAAAGGEKFAPG